MNSFLDDNKAERARQQLVSDKAEKARQMLYERKMQQAYDKQSKSTTEPPQQTDDDI